MALKIIGGGGIEKGTQTGVRNTIQDSELIIPADVQAHIDAILADPENGVDYINGLDSEVKERVLKVFQQIQKMLKE